MLALLAEPAIVVTAKEELPAMASLPVVEAIIGVLRAITELFIGKVIEGTTIEATGGMVGEATVHEVTMIPIVILLEVGHLAGILLMVTMDSSNQLHSSPPCAS